MHVNQEQLCCNDLSQRGICHEGPSDGRSTAIVWVVSVDVFEAEEEAGETDVAAAFATEINLFTVCSTLTAAGGWGELVPAPGF